MTIETLLNHFRSRVPWPTMRTILHMRNLPIGQGWAGTLQKLSTYEKLGEQQANELEALSEVYLENVFAGEKAVRFFEVNRGDAAQLIAATEDLNVPDSPFMESFPYPLDPEQLEAIDNVTTLARVEDLGHAVGFIFCTKRFVTERQELNLEAFGEEAREELRHYDEIITVKHRMRQFVDVVVLWKDQGFAEIRIDVGEGLSYDDQKLSFTGVSQAFNAFAQSCTNIRTILGPPINLFPLVDALYESDEGRVCELGFITDGASIKNEKMRRRDVDLRTEAYHRAGKNAVHHITPFRLGVTWAFDATRDVELKPELVLPGTVRVLSDRAQSLFDARIANCCGHQDFHFVVEKMREYLGLGEDEAAGAAQVAAN